MPAGGCPPEPLVAEPFLATKDHGAKLPPQEVDLIVRRLVMQGLAAGELRPDPIAMARKQS